MSPSGEGEERRFAVVTGASRGLGAALARGLAARGCTVAGCGRDAKRLDALSAELGPPHELAAVDVTSDAVEPWADGLIDRFGPPDLLVNNAALINAPAPLWQVPRSEFAAVVDVNLKGMHNVLAAFLPAMVSRQRGVVVNVSSGWGRSTSPEVAPYCATKFGVEGLSRALAQELPSGMAAVAVNPGIIDTGMLRRVWGGSAGSYPGPDEWATRAVPYLLGLGAADNGRSLSVPG